MIRIQFLFAASLALLLAGCEGPGGPTDGDQNAGQVSLNVDLRGSNLADAAAAPGARSIVRAAVDELPVACNEFFVPGQRTTVGCPGGQESCLPDAGTHQGSCISPMSITGNVVSVDLNGNYFGGGIRLLGGGSGMGQNFTIEGKAFDLADAEALGGEDNAQDTGFNELQTRASTLFNFLDIQFAVPRVVDMNSVTQFWTIKYVFVPYPFTNQTVYSRTEPTPGDVQYTDTGTTVADCLNTEFAEASQEADNNNAQLLGGVTGAVQGDILFCRKDAATDVCSAEDFQWLDTNLNQFVATRPADDSHVHKFATMADHKLTCEANNPGFDIDIGGFPIRAELYQEVHFSADLDKDSKIYEFQIAGDDSTHKQGDEIFMFIDFDVNNSLLVYDDTTDMTLTSTPDYSTYESLADEALAEMIWFKPVYLWENSSCRSYQPGDCENLRNGLRANIGVELSGNTEHPVFVCEDENDQSLECVAEEEASDIGDIH